MGGMKLKSIITRGYEKVHGLKAAKNKANLIVQRTRKLDDTYAISQCKVAVNTT